MLNEKRSELRRFGHNNDPTMAATSRTSIPGIKHLIVDTGALITSPVSSLRGLAHSFLITPDVVNELRDKKGREVIAEAQLQLIPPPGSEFKAGFAVREPSAAAVAQGEFDSLLSTRSFR